MHRKILIILVLALTALVMFVAVFFAFVNHRAGSDSGSSSAGQGGVQQSSAQPARQYAVHFSNFGDMMFDRLVKSDLAAGKNPFANLAGPDWNFLRQTDFNIANLEGPISTTTHCQTKAINFEFNPSVAPLIAASGFKLVNLANNHSFDCYIEGAQDTAKYLTAAGIDYMGGDYVNQPYTIKQVGNNKIAFVGFYAVLPSADINSMTALVKKLKAENNLVVVDVHWGEEYQAHSNAHQEDIAHQWIDAGADIIIGHHPHVVEEMEMYKGKPIFYSLGNFIFDQGFGTTDTGLGIEVSLVEPGAGSGSNTQNDIKLHPFNIIKRQPTLMAPEAAAKFCSSFLAGFTASAPCEIKY